MKQLKLTLIKKNRVFFKCTNESGYDVKLRITSASENLELGTHDLLLNDETIKTKYGTDVIYSLFAEAKKEDGIVTLTHRYNKILVDECRKLGGKWDETAKSWVFSKIIEEQVEALDDKYNRDILVVDITAKDDTAAGCNSKNCRGYPLARAFSRDSGAKVCDNVSMLRGKIGSGGSTKNWTTWIEKDTTFRLTMSAALVSEIDLEIWNVEIVK